MWILFINQGKDETDYPIERLTHNGLRCSKIYADAFFKHDYLPTDVIVQEIMRFLNQGADDFYVLLTGDWVEDIDDNPSLRKYEQLKALLQALAKITKPKRKIEFAVIARSFRYFEDLPPDLWTCPAQFIGLQGLDAFLKFLGQRASEGR